jgi:hypothetical protein
MVGLIRPPCLAIALATAGQRIRPKLIIFSVLGPRAGGGVLSNDPELGRRKATDESGRLQRPTFTTGFERERVREETNPLSCIAYWTFSFAEDLSILFSAP